MSSTRLKKIKKRIREAFPDRDEEALLRAFVPIIKCLIEENVRQTPKKQKTEPKQPKQVEKKKEDPGKEEEEDNDWDCAGQVWIIPNEPCPDGDTHGKTSGRARGKTRWGGKMHVLCKACRKDHEKWKRAQSKAKKKEEGGEN